MKEKISIEGNLFSQFYMKNDRLLVKCSEIENDKIYFLNIVKNGSNIISFGPTSIKKSQTIQNNRCVLKLYTNTVLIGQIPQPIQESMKKKNDSQLKNFLEKENFDALSMLFWFFDQFFKNNEPINYPICLEYLQMTNNQQLIRFLIAILRNEIPIITFSDKELTRLIKISTMKMHEGKKNYPFLVGQYINQFNNLKIEDCLSLIFANNKLLDNEKTESFLKKLCGKNKLSWGLIKALKNGKIMEYLKNINTECIQNIFPTIIFFLRKAHITFENISITFSHVCFIIRIIMEKQAKLENKIKEIKLFVSMMINVCGRFKIPFEKKSAIKSFLIIFLNEIEELQNNEFGKKLLSEYYFFTGNIYEENQLINDFFNLFTKSLHRNGDEFGKLCLESLKKQDCKLNYSLQKRMKEILQNYKNLLNYILGNDESIDLTCICIPSCISPQSLWDILESCFENLSESELYALFIDNFFKVLQIAMEKYTIKDFSGILKKFCILLSKSNKGYLFAAINSKLTLFLEKNKSELFAVENTDYFLGLNYIK